MHPFPVSVVVLTSGALLLVASGGYPGTSVLLRGLATVLASQVAVGSLNDYLDRDADRIFQPSKPIPSGLVPPWIALSMSVAGTVATAVLAASFGAASCAVMIVATCGGLAYDLWLKPTPFSLFGYLVGFLGLFTWIWLIAGQLQGPFWLVYPAGSLVVVAAHLANSAPDIETDRKQGLRNLAVLLGPGRTVTAIYLLYTLSTIPAFALAVLSGSLPAILLLCASAVLAYLSRIPATRFARSRSARVTVFRVFAPAVGLLGIGCLVALKGLT
jgi:4-hydroxybenzoate polyprenyltransferase